MFCANSECNFLLHTLLAHSIEYFGGSTELIRIFNRLGVVTSKDTPAIVGVSLFKTKAGTALRSLGQA